MREASLNTADPFPLLSMNYQEAQKHSEQVDAWLGFDMQTIEKKLLEKNLTKKPDQQHWIGLPVQTLLTPYSELRSMLSVLNPQASGRVIDLGAGYGRMGFVLARHYPEVQFVGYEIIEERVNEARRCLKEQGCTRATMICEDLSAPNFKVPEADIYFIYDYGARVAVLKTLRDLQSIAQIRPIIVIGRGRLSRDLIEQETPWLSQIKEPEHHGNFSIYRS